MIEKTESSKEITPKKVPRSLNNLLKVEKDLKTQEGDLIAKVSHSGAAGY